MMLRRVMMAEGGDADPYWSNVVSYLRFNAPAASTTFTDEVAGVTWSASGDAQMDDQSQLFGNNGLFDGNGDQIVCSTTWPLESQDFTLDMSYRPSTISGNRSLFYTGVPSAGGNVGVLLRATNGGGVLFAMLGGANVTAAGVFTVNTWHRIRVCRDVVSTRIYVDGALVATGVQRNGNFTTFPARIGSYRGSDYLDGRIDEVRLTMGVARTTGSSYVVDAGEFPNR